MATVNKNQAVDEIEAGVMNDRSNAPAPEAASEADAPATFKFNCPSLPNTRIKYSDSGYLIFQNGELETDEAGAAVLRQYPQLYVEADARFRDDPIVCDDCKARLYSTVAVSLHNRSLHNNPIYA